MERVALAVTVPSAQPPLEIISPEGTPLFLNPYSGTYSASRSYALRMQRNYARGITQAEARGHRPTDEGLTESQVRRVRFQERHGISYNDWARFYRRYVREINRRSFPTAPGPAMVIDNGVRRDPRIFPEDIAAVRDLYNNGFRDPVYNPGSWEEWTDQRLAERLGALVDFQDSADSAAGSQQFWGRTSAWIGTMGIAAAPPVEFWYYH